MGLIGFHERGVEVLRGGLECRSLFVGRVRNLDALVPLVGTVLRLRCAALCCAGESLGELHVKRLEVLIMPERSLGLEWAMALSRN